MNRSTDLVPGPLTRDIVTPEGVALQMEIGRAGDRIFAFIIDSVLMFGALILIAAAANDAMGAASGWLWAFITLILFLIQNFYFIWFESRERGATPGKRRLGLRVIDSSGGTLTIQAVVVRNVLRNLEFYLPLAALLAPDALFPGMPGWGQLISGAWLLVLAGLPLFNKHRLRAGDLVAGTMVVTEPKAVLLADVGRRQAKRKETTAARFTFTEAHLDVYGEYELQVLEDILRTQEHPADRNRKLAAVTDQIVTKIGYEEPIDPSDRATFLTEFYAALRARLEQRRLFGRRKADKHERS